MPKYTVITDGRKLDGEAMPRILAEFQKKVVGKRITAAGYIEHDGEAFPIIVLEDGSSILAQSDDECNGPGTLAADTAMLCKTSLK